VSKASDYMDLEYLPERMVMSEPSHLRSDSVRLLIDHWYTRQADELPVLRFHHVRSGDELQSVDELQSRAGSGRKQNKRVRYEDESSEDEIERLVKERKAASKTRPARKGITILFECLSNADIFAVKKAFTVRKGGRGPGPGSSSSNFTPCEKGILNNASSTIGTRTGDTISSNRTTNSPNTMRSKNRSSTSGTGTGTGTGTGSTIYTGTPTSNRGSTRVAGKETVTRIVPLTPSDIPTSVCSPFQPELQAIVDKVENENQKAKHSLPVLTSASTSIKSKAGKPLVDIGKYFCTSIFLADN
jgi:hypothetical protein